MISKSIAFAKEDPFSINSVKRAGSLVTINIKSKQRKSRCPLCNTYSRSIHSCYERKIKDLPAFGNRLLLFLTARKFYCHHKKCKRKVFTERFADHFTPYSRITERLRQKLLKVALLMGGNPGERLCRHLNLEASSSSLIRLIQKQDLHPVEKVIALGIDDWASKKRVSYGTILVDLERHKVVELLADRKPASVAKWLSHHPEVKIVSRDRFANYAKGTTAGAPGAIQVADRWHLLKNLCDGLNKLVERNHQHLKHAREREIQHLRTQYKINAGKKTPDSIKVVTKNFSRRLWQLQQIHALHQKGFSLKAIARKFKMSRNTVKKYLHLREPPRRKSVLQVNIALFDVYIRNRIEEEPNIQLMQLYKEIRQRGYNGGRTAAYDHLHGYINRPPRFAPPKLPDVFYLPSKVSFLLLRKKEQLTGREQTLVADLCRRCPEIKTAVYFATQFKSMMENKQGYLLQHWMDQAMACGVIELKSFASGLRSDFVAVRNALTLPWSNGQVEGQINKLKMIKRQMYGRASLELLRKRLLLDST